MTYRCSGYGFVFNGRFRFLALLFFFYLFDGERRVREGARAFNCVLRVKIITCCGECLRVPLSNYVTDRRVGGAVQRLEGRGYRAQFCVQGVGTRVRFMLLTMGYSRVVFGLFLKGRGIFRFPFGARRRSIFCVICVLVRVSGVSFICHGGIYRFHGSSQFIKAIRWRFNYYRRSFCWFAVPNEVFSAFLVLIHGGGSLLRGCRLFGRGISVGAIISCE